MFWTRLKKDGDRVRPLVHQLLSGAVVWLMALSICPSVAIAGSLELGLEALQHQQYATALSHFDQAIEYGEAADLAFGKRCVADLMMNHPQQAVEDCSRALDLNSDHASANFYRGLAFYRLGQYKNAVEDFTCHLQQHPGDARAYYNRGLAAFANSQLEVAIANYREALTYSSRLNSIELSNLYNDMGIAYLYSSELELSLITLDKAVALNGNDPRAYFNRGCVCHHQGRYVTALENFNQVLVLAPDNAEAYLNRGISKQQLGDREGAISDFESAAKLFRQQENSMGIQRTEIWLHQMMPSESAFG